MDRITFNTLFSGFSPLTSCAFQLGNGPWAKPGVGGKCVVATLSPYYKRGSDAMYVNLYPADLSQQSRKSDLFYSDNKNEQVKIKIFRNDNYGGKVASDITSHGNWEIGEVERIRTAIINANICRGDGSVVTLRDLQYDELLLHAQPSTDIDWLGTLPANVYRALAMRWCQCSSSDDRIKSKEGCTNAIVYNQPVSPAKRHPGWANPWLKGTPLNRMTSTCYVLDHPSISGTPSHQAVTQSPEAPANPPALATVGIPPMPEAGDDIMKQIEKLTERANAAGDLAGMVEQLAAEVHELKNRPQVVINTTPQFTSNGNVKLGDGEVPHFGLTAAGQWAVPEISPSYSLSGWTSRFQCGDLSETFSLADAVNAILSGTPTRLIGPPATGKTSGIVQACAHMGIPCRVIQCGKGLTEYTLLGEQTIESGSVVWKDGILPGLCRTVNESGPCIIVFDEIDHLAASIQSLLHGVLEGRMLDLPNGEKITIPDNVICVATANTYGTGDITGRHASANVSDDAFISRWVRTFTVDYLPFDEEKELLLAHGIPGDVINHLMTFIVSTRDQARKVDSGELSDGVRTPVTLRTLIPLAQDCANGRDFRKSFLTTVMGQFSPDEMPKVRELVRSILGF